MVDLLRNKIDTFDINASDSDVQCTLIFYEFRNLKNVDDPMMCKQLVDLERIMMDKIATVEDQRRPVFDIITSTTATYDMIDFTHFLANYYRKIQDPNRIEVINAIFQELKGRAPTDINTYVLFLNSISDRLTLVCGDTILSDQFRLVVWPIIEKMFL